MGSSLPASSLGDVGAGHSLGRYELLTPIAQGGMALVWAARIRGSRNFQKIVAIKTMLPQLSEDADFESMFLAEAELTARIHHPNVCEVLDLGEEDGTLYIAMEWVDGESLSTLMKAASSAGRSIPLAVAVSLVRDAARGLHAAHELRGEDGELVGLVHRDVSPQNILVTRDGVVKIVDFGIAKATARADESARTSAGQLKGKIPYMAPEQPLQGTIDRRTDVFALGVLLHQLVTGKHPFRAEEEMTTLFRLCEPKPFPPASSHAPSIPPALDAVIARALAKPQGERFATMADLAAALDGVRAGLGAPSHDDTARFVQQVLDGRLRKRRAVLQEAIRVADVRAAEARIDAARTNDGVAIPSVATVTATTPIEATPRSGEGSRPAGGLAPATGARPRAAWAAAVGLVAAAAVAAALVGTGRGPATVDATLPVDRAVPAAPLPAAAAATFVAAPRSPTSPVTSTSPHASAAPTAASASASSPVASASAIAAPRPPAARPPAVPAGRVPPAPPRARTSPGAGPKIPDPGF